FLTRKCPTTVEYPSPDRKKTGTTEQALSTNHETEPFVRCCSSEPFKRSASLFPIRVCLWLAAYLSHMPFEGKGTNNWVKPAKWPTCMRPCMSLHRPSKISYEIEVVVSLTLRMIVLHEVVSNLVAFE
uniref:Ovule protein n=1 Tax=Mesocestoides corti TaxID=53468 RepID=A0A5K3G276_MESCO